MVSVGTMWPGRGQRLPIHPLPGEPSSGTEEAVLGLRSRGVPGRGEVCGEGEGPGRGRGGAGKALAGGPRTGQEKPWGR